MELIDPFVKTKNNNEVSINWNNYVDDMAPTEPPSTPEPSPKKRGRPPKTKTMQDGSVMIKANDDKSSKDLTILQSNDPYISTYDETNMLLRGTIGDIDYLNGEVKGQLKAVIDSKTLKKKYDYISELSSTSANLLGTRIRTISEMNKIITESHNLDLRRMKDLKLSNAADEADSDKKMMDMYTAFINTPIGSYGITPPQYPSMEELTMANPAGGGGIDIGPAYAANNNSADPEYNKWRNTVSPETNLMILQKNNPNIKTVVVYDQTTNNKYFDVIDTATGQSVPNVPKPDPFLLADTYPNITNGTARNSNIDTVYPLVVIGTPSSIDDY